MTNQQIEAALSNLFEKWFGESPTLILPLAPSASPRIYYRLSSKNKVAVGAYNADKKENIAFLSFSKHFKERGLPVPEIYAENIEQNVYLQEDLGATTLYSYLLQKGDYFPDYLVQIYKKVVEKLNELNEEFEFIETGEREDLCEWIDLVIKSTGHNLDEYEDLTEDYREW